jgi:CBS domain-containing protein/ribosome-associated translation inhibitor RaiA
MEVGKIASKEFIAVSRDESLLNLVSSMIDKRAHEAVVVDEKGRYVGFIHYKHLVAKGIQDPSSMKVESVISHAPVLKESDSVEKAVELLFNTGFRALPVIDDKNKVVGLVTALSIAEHYLALFSGMVEKYMTRDVITVRRSDDIGKARMLMRERNISRLPVVEEDNTLCGEVTVIDLLRAVQPKERINWYSMAAEKLVTTKIPVETIMNRNPVVASRYDDLKDVVERMVENNRRGCIILDGKKPVGVITTRDILEIVHSSIKEREKGVLLQYSGIDEEDKEMIPVLDKFAEEFVRKVNEIYSLEYLHIHVKKYRKTGERKLYSVRCKVMSEKGVFVAVAQEWDIVKAVESCLANLERQIIKHKERLESTHRPRCA